MHWLTSLIKNWHFSWLICHLWCIFSTQGVFCAQHALYVFHSLGFVTELLCEIWVKRFQLLWSRGSTVCEVSAAESRSSSAKVKLSVHLDLISPLFLLSGLSCDDPCLRSPPRSHSCCCYWKCRASGSKWALRSDSCAGLIRYYWKRRRCDNSVSVAMLVEDSERLRVSRPEKRLESQQRYYRPAWISYSPSLSVVLFHMCVWRDLFHTPTFFPSTLKIKLVFTCLPGERRRWKCFLLNILRENQNRSKCVIADVQSILSADLTSEYSLRHCWDLTWKSN